MKGRVLSCRVIALITLALAFFISTAAHADERYRVVLLERQVRTKFAREVLTRVRAELAAEGYDLRILSAPRTLSAEDAVGTGASELLPDAVLLVEQRVDRRTGLHSAELWLSDRFAQKTFVQRLNVNPADPARGATWVAIQALELVRAREADSTIKRRRVSSAVAPPQPKPEPQPAPRDETKPDNIAVGAALAMVHGFNGLSTVIAPLVRISARVPVLGGSTPLALHLRLSGSTFAGKSVVEWQERRAEVGQSFATFDAVLRFAPGSIVQPLLSIGTGAYAVDVRGASAAPYHNNDDRTWSAVGTLGTGIWLEPFPGIACALEGQVMAAWSKTIVHLGERKAVEAGSPVGILNLGLFALF